MNTQTKCKFFKVPFINLYRLLYQRLTFRKRLSLQREERALLMLFTLKNIIAIFVASLGSPLRCNAKQTIKFNKDSHLN